MFNFKAFVATTIAAASFFAAPVEAFTRFSYEEQLLVSALETAGVTVEQGDCEEAFGIDNTYGFYYHEEKYIAICTDVVEDDAKVWETLRHEAIHAAQGCIDPSMQTTAHRWAYVEKNANETDAQFIVRAYDREDWAIELEAFTFMRRSNSYVAAVVNSACN